MTVYTVRLPVYEGPLDLLLELIERAELDITKIALAQVTDQYLAHLRSVAERDLADLASFLVVATRLLQIKSEALLPRPPEREPGEEDPGDALARQLILYRQFKQAAGTLTERLEAGLHSYTRRAPPPHSEPHLDLGDLSLARLRRTLLEVLASTRPESGLADSIVAPRINIRHKIGLIFDALRRRGRMGFGDLLRRSRSRLEIVVSFLAVLELIKQHQVLAIQEKLFGEIEIVPGADWRPDQEVDLELEFDE
ncbi:MAG TPA: segregation/condensation protein A [Anaerolineales bacterium]|nr:segregation/condensation protein A [Anaerolineales bacterium]